MRNGAELSSAVTTLWSASSNVAPPVIAACARVTSALTSSAVRGRRQARSPKAVTIDVKHVVSARRAAHDARAQGGVGERRRRERLGGGLVLLEPRVAPDLAIADDVEAGGHLVGLKRGPRQAGHAEQIADREVVLEVREAPEHRPPRVEGRERTSVGARSLLRDTCARAPAAGARCPIAHSPGPAGRLAGLQRVIAGARGPERDERKEESPERLHEGGDHPLSRPGRPRLTPNSSKCLTRHIRSVPYVCSVADPQRRFHGAHPRS